MFSKHFTKMPHILFYLSMAATPILVEKLHQAVKFVSDEKVFAWVLVSAAITLVIILTGSFIQRRSKARKNVAEIKKGGYVLHQFPRWRYSPNSSPFCVKLETYLRLARIPHTLKASGMGMSKKGKQPWMEIDGEHVADSFFCIERLSSIHNFDLNARLTSEQRAICHAFERMLGENFNWVMLYERWVLNTAQTVREIIPLPSFFHPLLRWQMKRTITARLQAQGIGAHSHEEIMEIGRKDILALVDLLGNKKFMFGDSPTQLDASAFSWLCQMIYSPFDTDMTRFVQQEPACKPLLAYVERVKSSVYKDWDTIVRHKKKQA